MRSDQRQVERGWLGSRFVWACAGVLLAAACATLVWQSDKIRTLWLNRSGPSPKSRAPSSDEALLDALGTLGARRVAADEDLRVVCGSGWRDNATPLVSQMKNGAGVDPFSQLPDKGREAGAIRAVFGLKPEVKLPSEDVLQLRQYLYAWRGQLRALRESGKIALRGIDAGKLVKAPTLALVKTLTSDKDPFAMLDAKPGVMPVIPWFSKEDKLTAEAIDHLFVFSDAGKEFFGPNGPLQLQTRPNNIREILAQLHTPGTSEKILTAAASERVAVLLSDHPGESETRLHAITAAMRAFHRFLMKHRLPSKKSTGMRFEDVDTKAAHTSLCRGGVLAYSDNEDSPLPLPRLPIVMKIHRCRGDSR